MITLEEQIDLIRIGLETRRRDLDVRVESGMVSRADADWQIARLEAVLQSLRDYKALLLSDEQRGAMDMDALFIEQIDKMIDANGAKGALREVLRWVQKLVSRYSKMEAAYIKLMREVGRGKEVRKRKF